MIARALIFGAAFAALAACATQTPYGPAVSEGGYGYHEQRIETNRYRVSFNGNSLTDLETVESSLLYRAAELTLQNGYDWFSVVDRDSEANTSVRGGGYGGYGGYHPYHLGFHHRYYHPRGGWYPWYDPFYGGSSIHRREITRYEASAEIALGRGAKPADNVRAYDAREVANNLRGQVFWPEA